MSISNIIAIVVIYNQKIDESETLITLNSAVNGLIDVIIYDNSEKSSATSNFSLYQNLRIKYFHNPDNPGISAAYNYALNLALHLNKDWLLLLDQDTGLTHKYFDCLSSSIKEIDSKIVCILPRIISKSNNKIISPLKMLSGGFLKPLNTEFGTIDGKFTAINSATVISIKYLESIGGFDKAYKLDMLDYWLFRDIFRRGKSALLLDTEIVHDLSVDNFKVYMSLNRYKALLDSEKKFFKSDGWLSYQTYKTRLLIRSIKFAIHSKGKYAIQTIRHLI